MTKCNHKQCHICLMRECHSLRLQKFGEIFACEACIRKAVYWAYESALKWGGDYGTDICGRKKVTPAET